MDAQTEIGLFVEELWERILDLRVGCGLSDEEVLAAVNVVRGRMVRLIEVEE